MPKIIKKLNKKLSSFGESISEPGLIKFDLKVIYLLLTCFVIFVGFIFVKASGSSVGYWNVFMQNDAKNEFQIGKSRAIRSDEWFVHTPFAISQSNKSYAVNNYNFGVAGTALIISTPVKHLTTVFRPQFWGYFFMSFERGFSFFWCFKVFSLIISVFLMLMLLTKNNFYLSLFGAMWVFFSGFMQWWFSFTLPETVGLAALIFVAASYFLLSKKKISVYLAAIILTVSMLDFALILYPPFQVPMIYLTAIVFMGFLLRGWKANFTNFKSLKGLRFILVAFVLVAVVATLIVFYKDAKPALSAITSTAYPGSRVSVGNESKMELFEGYYGILLRESRFPINLSNVCEASNFILFYPVILFLYLISYFKTKKIDPVVTGLGLFLIAATLWVYFPIPTWFARISLISYIPVRRGFLGIGMASILITILWLSEEKRLELKNKLWLPVLVFLASLGWGYLFKVFTGNFLHSYEVLTISLLLAFSSWCLQEKKAIPFILIVSFMLLPGVIVNPIRFGMGPIYDKEAYSYLKNIDNKDSRKWVLFGENFTPILKASGENVFNGIAYTARNDDMKVLDGNPSDKYIYNRYANIVFNESDSTDARLNLASPDNYGVAISPCSLKLKEIGITNIAFTYEPDISKNSCLVPMLSHPLSGIWLYKYK